MKKVFMISIYNREGGEWSREYFSTEKKLNDFVVKLKKFNPYLNGYEFYEEVDKEFNEEPFKNV